MTIELPEFATGGVNETEPTAALKASGWADGDQPPAQVFNWLHRTGYETLLRLFAQTAAIGLGRFSERGSLQGNTDPISVDPSTGDILVGLKDLSAPYDTAAILVSSDAGKTFTSNALPSSTASANLSQIGIVPGVYAVAFAGTGLWYYAAYPYTSWTKVESATFTSAPTGHSDIRVASLDGVPSLIISEEASTYLAYAAAGSSPTSPADWNEVNIGFTILSFTANDDWLVVGISDGSGDAAIAYAPSSAGGLPGDWTVVVLDTTATTIQALGFDGTAFVAVDNTNQVHVATNPSGTWTLIASTLETALTGRRAIVEARELGLLVLGSNSNGDPIYASADGHSFSVARSAFAYSAVNKALVRDSFVYYAPEKRFMYMNGPNLLVSGN